jgi:hypothetical protein
MDSGRVGGRDDPAQLTNAQVNRRGGRDSLAGGTAAATAHTTPTHDKSRVILNSYIDGGV